jgi:hypothetical protein
MNMQIKSWEAFLLAVVNGEVNCKAVERMLKLTSSIAASVSQKFLLTGAESLGLFLPSSA